MINTKAKHALQDAALKGSYDTSTTHHRFHLSVDASSNHWHFTQGDALVTKMSSNLIYLVGFSEVMIDTNVMEAREVDTLSNHSRQLNLYSNVIQPTA